MLVLPPPQRANLIFNNCGFGLLHPPSTPGPSHPPEQPVAGPLVNQQRAYGADQAGGTAGGGRWRVHIMLSSVQRNIEAPLAILT